MVDRATGRHGIIVAGAGGHARVVMEAVLPRRVVGHLSPTGSADDVDGLGPRLGSDADAARFVAAGHDVAVGIGFVDRRGALRRAAALDALGDIELLTVVHDHAVVSPSASIGRGSFVAAGAVLGPGAQTGHAALVNTGAIVDHDTVLGRNVHIGPGATISGTVTVGDDTLIGVGATVRQGVRIGARVVVGAGSVVVGDVADDSTVVGVPARRTMPA